MKVVCDSTALIGLVKVGKIELLRKIFSEIIIPEAVYAEVVIQGEGKEGSEEVKNAPWKKREEVKDKRAVELLSRHLNKGEAEVLILGKELEADWLVIDEDEARDSAFSAGFKVIGLAGILLAAKDLGYIKEIKPLLDELRSKNFWIGASVYETILNKAKELS